MNQQWGPPGQGPQGHGPGPGPSQGYGPGPQGYGQPGNDPYRYGAGPQYMGPSPDDQNLRILQILTYVHAGLMALGAIFSVLYMVIGGAMMAGSVASHDSDSAGLAGVGGIFLVIGGICTLLIALVAGLTALAARNIGRRTGYTLVIVMACFSLLNIPLGTALGIFTLIILSKPQVKALFQ